MISDQQRRQHDLGATEHPPFELDEHEASDVDKRVDAMVNLLAAPEISRVRPDERRRGIEELDDEAYHSFSYYQRWLAGVTNILVEKGIVGAPELVARLDAVKRRQAADTCNEPGAFHVHAGQ